MFALIVGVNMNELIDLLIVLLTVIGFTLFLHIIISVCLIYAEYEDKKETDKDISKEKQEWLN